MLPSNAYGQGSRVSGADELADRPLGRPALEAHDEAETERTAELSKGLDPRPVLPALDSRDGGVTGPHASCELRLSET